MIPLAMWALCRAPSGLVFYRVVEAVRLVAIATAMAVTGQVLARITMPANTLVLAASCHS